MTAAADRRRGRRRLLVRFAAITGLAVALPPAAAAAFGAAGAALGLTASLALLWAGSRGLRRPGAIPVIVYHSVSPDAGWLPWSDSTSVRPQTFRRHMETLRTMGRRPVASADLVAMRRAGATPAPETVVLHFDDGYLDNYLEAAPILREFGFPATIFASSDFIDPSTGPRPPEGGRAGYMNRDELRALDADPLFEIASHGLDHGRIPVAQRVMGQLNEANWRRHAPQIWSLTTGSKARWYLARDPAPLRLGDPIYESDSKLCGRWLRGDGQESEAERDARVEAELSRARIALEDVLGRPVDVLCWPFDRWTAAARAAAERAGFSTFTGGRGENRADEDPAVLSRVHVHDHAFGGGPLWLEGLAFRAKVHTMSGNLYWSPVVMLASLLRRRRFATPGVHE